MYIKIKSGNIYDMKKMLLLFFIVPLALGWFIKNEPSKVLFLDGIEKICVVTDENVKEFDSLETASDNYVLFNSREQASKVKPKGIVLYMNTELDKLKKELNLIVDRTERINDMDITYGFTPQYDGFVLSNNKRINAQIVVQGDRIIAGFPMILTGF